MCREAQRLITLHFYLFCLLPAPEAMNVPTGQSAVTGSGFPIRLKMTEAIQSAQVAYTVLCSIVLGPHDI